MEKENHLSIIQLSIINFSIEEIELLTKEEKKKKIDDLFSLLNKERIELLNKERIELLNNLKDRENLQIQYLTLIKHFKKIVENLNNSDFKEETSNVSQSLLESLTLFKKFKNNKNVKCNKEIQKSLNLCKQQIKSLELNIKNLKLKDNLTEIINNLKNSKNETLEKETLSLLKNLSSNIDETNILNENNKIKKFLNNNKNNIKLLKQEEEKTTSDDSIWFLKPFTSLIPNVSKSFQYFKKMISSFFFYS